MTSEVKDMHDSVPDRLPPNDLLAGHILGKCPRAAIRQRV